MPICRRIMWRVAFGTLCLAEEGLANPLRSFAGLLAVTLGRFWLSSGEILKVMTLRLNKRSLLKAVQSLEVRDRHLKMIVSKFGPPPLWEREQGFQTLIHIILEQQVSLGSAKAAYEKLLKATGHLTPDNFCKLSDTILKSIGFSRQKTSYGRNLAEAIVEGSLDLSELARLDDAEVKEQLMKIKGIGSWTADIYLLTALGRPDIWPNSDLALAGSVQRLKGMPTRPSPEKLEAMSRKWRPWRAVAARILWHFYLSNHL